MITLLKTLTQIGVVDKLNSFLYNLLCKSLKHLKMSQTTPIASHAETYSEEEYLDVDTWFKTTDDYKEMQKPSLERTTNLMGNTGKQEPELEEIAPLCLPRCLLLSY